MENTFEKNWVWYELELNDQTELNKITNRYSSLFLKDWQTVLKEKETNFIKVDTSKRGDEAVSGSLIYKQNLSSKEDYEIFYFFITEKYFITSNLNFSKPDTPDRDLLLQHMTYADNATEGFSILLGEIMKNNLKNIDVFELRMNDLLWKIKEKNSTSILEEIYQCRHELLVAKNLLIPIREIKTGLDEAFGECINQTMEYQRTCKRINRGLTLIADYEQEIDTLINLEEVVSSHRGNEIMKTLTVLTTLFTPVMAWGALWGMNFEHMPELKWKYGYLYSVLLIVFTTISVYVLLKKKGWFGDILKGKKRNTFFK